MGLTLKPIVADFRLKVSYKEAMLSLVELEEKRIPLVRNILEIYDLRLDDIKFNREALSGNFIQFIKHYDSALFGVHFGLEETSSDVFRAKSEKQAFDLYGKLFQILDEIPISSLTINIGQQLSAEADLELFLESLNPNPPDGFRDLLSGRGVQYNLRIPNHNLSMYVILASSMFYDKALYLNIEYQFSPYIYDFQASLKVVMEYYSLALKELGIHVQREE